MDLRDYVMLAARNWLVLAVTTVVGLMTAGVLVVVATPQYEARAQVLFSARNAANGRDLAYAGTYVQSRIQTYKDLAVSPVVLAPVIESEDLDLSTGALADRVEVEVSQIDTVVTLEVRDPDGETAARVANRVAASLLTAVAQIEARDPDLEQTGAVTVDGRVVGPAEEPSDPADPDTVLYLLAGLLGGLVIGAGVVGVRHLLQPRPEPARAAA